MFGAQEIGFSGFTRNSLRPPEAGFAAHTATNCCSSYIASKRRGHPTNQDLMYSSRSCDDLKRNLHNKNVLWNWNLLILRYGKKLMSCQAQELKKVIKFLQQQDGWMNPVRWIFKSIYTYIFSALQFVPEFDSIFYVKRIRDPEIRPRLRVRLNFKV